MLAVAPDRADRVNDPFGRQPVALGDLRLAGRAAAQRPALREQLRPGGAMNRAIHAAAAQQGRVRGVHDGVHRCFVMSPFDHLNPVQDHLRCSLRFAHCPT